MNIRKILSRRGMAGFGIATLAAGVLATVPTAANALPQIRVDKVVDFGAVAVGNSVERAVTFTNTGNPGVPEDTAYGLTVIPTLGAAPFQFVGSTCSFFPTDFAGGQSCTVTYRFTPTDSAAAIQPLSFFVTYNQDTDPGPLQNLVPIQRELKSLLVGNVTCGGQAPTIYGTPGDDEISGTSGNDVITTLDGNDVVKADGGNDIVCGGDDSDTLKGGAGKDKLYGEGGSDILKGGKGTDTCVGGLGVDRAKKCEKVSSL